MIGRCVYRATQTCGEAEGGLDATAEPGADLGGAKAEIRSNRDDERLTATFDVGNHICNAPSRTATRVVDQRRPRKALPHGGPRGEDDQVAGLEAAGDGVQVVESGGGAGDRLALAGELGELGRLAVEHELDRAEVLAAVLVGDLEDG